jgi:signal transduction histidine kinase
MRSTWLRDKRRGLLAFLLVCALVAGGLGWVTAAVLRLEREQSQAQAQAERAERFRLVQQERVQRLAAQRRQREQEQAQAQEEFAGRVRLALWRLDSRLALLLAREETRPYSQYSALFAPPVALDSKGMLCAPATVLEPSPLLNADLPEWMLLHFQSSAEAGWGSPQVLPDRLVRQLGKDRIALANVTARRRLALAELARAAGPRALLGRVQQEEARLSAALPHRAAEGRELLLTQAQDDESGKNKDLAQAVGRRVPELGYGSRAQQKGQLSQEAQQMPFNESVYSVLNNFNTAGGRLPLPPPAASEQVLVSVGPMMPLWLPAPGGQELLVIARLVRLRRPEDSALAFVGSLPGPGRPLSLALASLAEHARRPAHPREVCQGIILDWSRLRGLLAEDVRDLFPDARILPMREETPPRPERTMTVLPVELDPGPGPTREPEGPQADEQPPDIGPVPVPELGWTPLRVGLALSWLAALVALSAVGLGGWSLLDLSQRRIRFVSAVTHELRTPLTTLRLYLEMLTGGLVRDERQKEEYLQTLHAESERLNRLVGNVLDFSRLENQRPRLELAAVPVTELLEQARASWQTRCQDAGKELVIESDLADGASVVTDAQLVQQVLGNLIDNACKYSRGAEDARLWLRARAGEKGRLWLEVEDRGPGVVAAEQRHIFEPFRRGRGADVTAGGVGLGLALAQRWAGLLGGQLMLHSAQDHLGARFRLDLPLSKDCP